MNLLSCVIAFCMAHYHPQTDAKACLDDAKAALPEILVEETPNPLDTIRKEYIPPIIFPPTATEVDFHAK